MKDKEPEHLNDMTTRQLKELARKKQVSNYSRLPKWRLLQILEEKYNA